MKKTRRTSTKIYVAATMCVLVAVLGLTAGYYSGQKDERAQIADDLEEYQEYTASTAQEKQTESETKDVYHASEDANQTAQGKTSTDTNSENATNQEATKTTGDLSKQDTAADTNEVPSDAVDVNAVQAESAAVNEQTIETMSGQTKAVAFTEDSTLLWPVDGNVILDYDMDKMVYFETLDQYKYNPAILIAAAVNDPVRAAASGTVIDVSTNEETGKTITVDIGNSYQLTYGQIKEAACASGDSINAGDIIGYVSEPTKYYSVEGTNLYFKMTNASNPVDPVDFFGAE